MNVQKLKLRLKEAKIESFFDFLLPYFESTILFQTKRVKHADELDLSIGTSKIGGNPHVPSGFKWPCTDVLYVDEAHDGVVQTNESTVKSLPLTFIAQINCAEIAKYDRQKRLPTEGMLYFFYAYSLMCDGSELAHATSFRVIYENVDVAMLSRMPCVLNDVSSSLVAHQLLPKGIV